MSQRPSIQGPRSTYEPGTQFATSSGHQYASAVTSSPSAQRTSTLPPPPQPSGRGLELPPLLRVPGGSTGSVSPSIPRSVTLPSVLNPYSENPAGQRRRKADELASPRDSAPTLPPLIHASQTSAAPPGPGRPAVYSQLNEPADRAPRRTLTPKSPMRRTISLSHLNHPSGSINAHQNPFPTSPRSRAYYAEPGTADAPPLPTPSAGMRQGGYSFPSIVPPPTDLPRRRSPEMQRYSPSPSPGYSPYDQDENSPTGYSVYDQSGSGYLTVGDHSRNAGRGTSVSPSVVTSGSQYNVPVTSAAGQSTYQMMTLKTTEGDVRFPVDVQAASRVADEKRKRNAGASARFRERRKKKEMEAATTISKLEQRVKDVTEDATFYKKERDVLAGIVRGINGGERQLSARPPSPRLRRNASNPSAPAHASSSSYSASGEANTGSPEMGRNVRRRTSSFPMAQAPAAIPQSFAQGVHHPHQSTYAPPPPHMHTTHQNPQQPPGSLPLLPPAARISGYSGHSGAGLPPPPPVMQAPPMTGPYNPFASRYDQRPPANGR